MVTPGQQREGDVDVDVLVVGAGPTGLTLAAVLQDHGTAFRLVDRQLDRVRESRAVAVQPRSLEVFAALGLADELLERGNSAVELHIHAGAASRPVPLFDIGLSDTSYPTLLFLAQSETERLLGERLTDRGAEIERGVELVEATDNGSAVDCRLRHGDGRCETVRTRYLVGCDGAHSTVRQLAGIPFEGRAYPHTFLLGDVEADALARGTVHVFMGRRGILFFFPLGTPATWRLLTMRPSGAPGHDPFDGPLTLAELQQLADRFTGGVVTLRDPAWLTTFRLHNRGAPRYRTGRMLIAGDAAHIHSPAGGQGMNTGIQDAFNLGWKLAYVTGGAAAPDLLETYQPERLPVGRAVLRFTDRAFSVATSDNPLARLARAHLVPRLAPRVLRTRAGRRAAFRTISQLAFRYRGSAAAVDGAGAPRQGPRAGDRLPDAEVMVAGARRTLHAEAIGTAYHLLLCGPAEAWPGEVTAGSAWPTGGGSSGVPRPTDVEAGPGRGSGSGPPPAAGRIRVRRLIPGAAADDDPPTVLRDTTGAALRRLGFTRTGAGHILVRPDGHVGYRGRGTDLGGVRAYLDRWGAGAGAPR